jgi:hypothetical protein
MAKKGEKTAKNRKRNQQNRAADADDIRDQPMDDHAVLPSQAEGEREVIEDELHDYSGAAGDQGRAKAPLYAPKQTPSQAEGERETVEEDLGENRQDDEGR